MSKKAIELFTELLSCEKANRIFNYWETFSIGDIEQVLAELQTEPENTVANLLCYILDNHELEPLSEETLQGIGAKFLESKYNKQAEPSI